MCDESRTHGATWGKIRPDYHIGRYGKSGGLPITIFHGLRHTYAAEKYMDLIQNGTSALDAHFEVSRLLGHERADVTNIYLASLPKEDRHGK